METITARTDAPVHQNSTHGRPLTPVEPNVSDQRDENGRRLVVRNGYHQPRQVTTAVGVVEVKAPRVNDKRVDEAMGERKRFSSAILPPCRKSPKISEVLALLYLHGLSSGDFVPALEQFLDSSAGLSPATITRLTQQWQADHATFLDRDLAEVDYVYVWADGIHLNVRACVLVLIRVRADGSNELVALKGGRPRGPHGGGGSSRREQQFTAVGVFGTRRLFCWCPANDLLASSSSSAWPLRSPRHGVDVPVKQVEFVRWQVPRGGTPLLAEGAEPPGRPGPVGRCCVPRPGFTCCSV